MNFVEEYYSFKKKWCLKIGTLLLNFYICQEQKDKVNKIKYEFFEKLALKYINHDLKNVVDIDEQLENNYKSLSKVETELLKYVIAVSKEYKKIKFTEKDYIYFAFILESTIALYNATFTKVNRQVINDLLKENLFRFYFIDLNLKQSRFNVLLRYLKYINKNVGYYFANMNNKNVTINVTSLSLHRNYFVIDIENHLSKLRKYDDYIIESLNQNNNYATRIFILNFDLLVQKIVYMLETQRFNVEKVIFNLDNYTYDKQAIKYINSYNKFLSKYIMFSSCDRRKLDYISKSYDKCIYIDDEKNHKITDYDDIKILVKNTFWNSHKKDSNRLKMLEFITISSNIIYKFEKKEM